MLDVDRCFLYLCVCACGMRGREGEKRENRDIPAPPDELDELAPMVMVRTARERVRERRRCFPSA